MANGGHFVMSGDGSRMFHWEEDIGCGRFPVAPVHVSFVNLTQLDPHNESLDQIWSGTTNNNAGSDYAYVWEWNGSAWIRHDFFLGVGPGHTWVSRVPGTNEVFCGIDNGGGPWNYWYKYDGVGTWTELRPATKIYNHRGWIPWAFSSSLCVWISSGPYNSMPGFWSDVYNQVGGGLPIEGFTGICADQNGTIFLLSNSGDVWRSDGSGGSPNVSGPFVLDNPSTPFGSPFNYDSSLNIAKDGVTVVCQKNDDNYWVRSGPDNWVDKGPMDSYGPGQCSAVNDQILIAGSTNYGHKISTDGGATWFTAFGGNISEVGTCALSVQKSSARRMLALYEVKSVPATLWWRGDAPYSPWARWDSYRANPDSLIASSSWMLCLEGFPTGEVVIGVNSSNNSFDGFWHYDPIADSWSAKPTGSGIYPIRVHGTEFAAGRIHGAGQSTTIRYMRWNGTSYDVSAISGSTAAGGLQISASEDGQHIWIVGASAQLWHSSDGGSSWTNRHAAAAAVHADADQAKDVLVVSPTEVFVAFKGDDFAETRFSKWNGSAWSIAAPNLQEDPGDKCLLLDGSGDVMFWSFTDFAGGDAGIHKLVSGSWVEQYRYSGQRISTGLAALANNRVIAASYRTPNIPASNCPADGLDWIDGIAGSSNLPNSSEWWDVSAWGFNVDEDPPTVTNQDPAEDAVGVDAYTDISLDVIDQGESPQGVDPDTVVIRINGVVVWQNRQEQSGWAGTEVALANDNYRYLLSGPGRFTYGSQVQISIDACDLVGNCIP